MPLQEVLRIEYTAIHFSLDELSNSFDDIIITIVELIVIVVESQIVYNRIFNESIMNTFG